MPNTIVKTPHALIAFACAGFMTIAHLLTAAPGTANKPIKPTSFPTTGKVLTLTSGDLMCYVELLDRRGVKHNLGADFDICDQSKLLNKRVNLTYKWVKVSNCQTNPNCGKTRIGKLVVKMKLVPQQ